jgi:predicted nucleic acid-binding protein
MSAKSFDEMPQRALRLIDSFAVEWISCDRDILDMASRIKTVGRICVADSWIGATAAIHKAILVHKDPEFLPFKDILQETLT